MIKATIPLAHFYIAQFMTFLESTHCEITQPLLNTAVVEMETSPSIPTAHQNEKHVPPATIESTHDPTIGALSRKRGGFINQMLFLLSATY
jgi:hypothetical protein